VTELSRIIAEEIRQNGPISAARFMELALYCPVYGYYERDADSVGRLGDFLTSVSVGPLLGELLASRFVHWLDQLRQQETGVLHLVEAAAHRGRLAGDILGWIQQRRPDLIGGFQYHILEPSTTQQERQKVGLKDFLAHVRWHSGWEALRQVTGTIRGVIFSNELLDAQPIRRLAWDQARRTWFEWRVNFDNDRFHWIRSPTPLEACLLSELAERVPPEIQAVLPHGYVVELSPKSEEWWKTAAETLQRGWLLTFDYGFDDDTALMPERTDGTLRGYHRHQAVADVLANPGTQDLTTHVHFGRIRRVGETAGLTTEFCGEQGRFLTQCLAGLLDSDETLLTPNTARLRQFKTLIHPDHFGRSFGVLLQSRPGGPS